MSRKAELRPIRIDGVKRSKPWMLRVPPHLSETGLRQKIYFATEEEAKIEAERYQSYAEALIAPSDKINPLEKEQSATAFQLVKDSGFAGDFLTIVKKGLESFQDRSYSRTFEDLVTEYVAKHAQWTKKYARSFEKCCEKFSKIQKTFVCDLRLDDVLSVFRTFKPSVRNAAIRMLYPMFKYAVNRHYLKENLILKDEHVSIPRKEVCVASNDVVAGMLNDALENDLGMVPYLVFGFFAGIRPESEMTRVLWSDWDLSKRCLTIRAEICKTKRTRFISPLSDNVLAWLQAYQDRGGKMEGYIANVHKATLAIRRNRILDRIGSAYRWEQDVMRHSFCSNWLTANGSNYFECARLAGHDPKVLERHYHAGIWKDDAAVYWQIFPPKQDQQKEAA